MDGVRMDTWKFPRPGEKDQPQDEKGWYRKDEIAVPAVNCLQPRTGPYTIYGNWEKIEVRLRSIFQDAISTMNLDEKDRLKYEASATEQEIMQGALNPPKEVLDAKEHVFGFFRNPDTPPTPPPASTFK